MSPHCDLDLEDLQANLYCMIVRLVITQHHFKFGHKRLSDAGDIVRTEFEHTKGPDTLSDSVRRFDQLLQETSAADQ